MTGVLGLALPGFFAGEARAAERFAPTNLVVFRTPAGKVRPVLTTNDWAARRAVILDGMRQVMGPLPGAEKRCPLDVKILEEVDGGEFIRRQITYASEPGGRVPAFLLIPKSALNSTSRAPAVLALHQTHPAGRKVVVGLGQSPDDEYGVELARRGYVVLAPPYPLLADYQPDIKALGYRSGTMKAIWDNLRGLDVLSALPFVRTNGFGVIGHSLGGHNGVFTAAFDERIQAVVSSCGLDRFPDYYEGDPKNWQPERGWCQTRYMPALTNYAGRLSQIPFDFPEVIGALAPRGCFISAPVGDTNFRWRSVEVIAGAARRVYRLYGAVEHLRVEHPPGGHAFPKTMREEAYRFLDAHLK